MGYFFRYFLKMCIYFLIVTLIAFLIVRVIPVDPMEAYLNIFNLPLTDENIKIIEKEMGLNLPIFKQYILWLKNILNLDFGKSYVLGVDVYEYLKTSFYYTSKLVFFSLLWIIFFGIFFGILSSIYNETKFDKIIKIFSLFEVSFPKFWLGFLLVYLFAVKLKIFPVSGAYSKNSVILPSITLALSSIGYYTQFVKDNMLSNLSKDFVKYAKIRKVKKRRIFFNYAFLNSLNPLVISIFKTIANLLSGSMIVENIFSWPGLGRLIVEAIDGRDYPIIQAYILIISFIYIFFSSFGDMICSCIDPRVKRKKDVENEKIKY